MEPTLATTDKLNLAVTRAYARRRRVDHESAFLGALSSDANPTDLFVYLTYLSSAWSMLMYGFALLSVVAGFLEHKLDGSVGWHAFAVVSFFTAACFVGEVDAGWRRTYANGASRPGVDPSDVARLVRKARASSQIGVLLQVVGGLMTTAFLFYIS